MRACRYVFSYLIIPAIALLLWPGCWLDLFAQTRDLSQQYVWKPVRIGAGGFVVGLTLHPLDSRVRFARTDVGNAYRWDEPSASWIGMRVANADGSGIHSAADTVAPSVYGVDSVAVDPHDRSVVHMVFPTVHSTDVDGAAGHYVQLYTSTDGGRNFEPRGLIASRIEGDPNGEHRQYGERLVVDPANSHVLYYCSDKQGLWRSLDSGATWSAFAPASGLPNNVEFINVQFGLDARRTDLPPRLRLTENVFAVSIRNHDDGGGDVYRSTDGGQTWTDISAGIVDAASGMRFAGQAAASSMDTMGTLYVVENPVTKGSGRAFWKFAAGEWTRCSLEGGAKPAIAQPLTSVAADPTKPGRLYAMGVDTSLSRSDDSGHTWTSLGAAAFRNRLGWLPQTVGMEHGSWRSNGGLRLDAAGRLWVPTGQEGVLTMEGAAAAHATQAAPPEWEIRSTGIEEQVSQDATVLRDGHDTMVLAAEDTTGFVINDPDRFTAGQISLQREIIAQGTSVDAAPDDPHYIAITSSNVYTNGPSYSGYSADGGLTWKPFGATLRYTCEAHGQCDVPAGQIAVSARGGRAAGQENLVVLPPLNLAPEYSLNGGQSWQVAGSFPLASDGLHLDIAGGAWKGFIVPELHQRLLRADPFVPGKFYLKFTHAPASLYVSVDGGAQWSAMPNAQLPDMAFHGQLAVNPLLRDDLWYADGWEGSAMHGVFHSTDGGRLFVHLAGFPHAINIAIGAGSGIRGDAVYSVYVYGQLGAGEEYGVFQSTDAGASWNRIARYPLGIYDRPITLAASADTFGMVVLGWTGNSFAYCRHR